MTQTLHASADNFNRPSRFGHVHIIYVMGADQNGPVKIGTSADVAQRVFSLQTGNPMPLMVLGLRLALPRHIPGGKVFDWKRAAKEHATKVEKQAHWDLRKLGLGMVGEWFDITASEALEVLDKSAETVRSRCVSLEWLLSGNANRDSEIGWMVDKMTQSCLEAKAQAAMVNELGLTLQEEIGNI